MDGGLKSFAARPLASSGEFIKDVTGFKMETVQTEGNRTVIRLCLLGAVSLLASAFVLGGECRAGGDWRLEWSEEFAGHEINSAVWTFEEGWVRNNELQYYTVGRKENAKIEDGKLVITARKERWPNRFYSPSAPTNNFKKGRAEASYTSASLHSRGKFEFRYGRLEVKAKIPEGLGTWPAIWMCGSGMRWPKCGEIDVMEAVGYRPGRVFATTHWADLKTGKHVQKGGFKDAAPADGFHLYGIEWDENRIDYFYDGEKYHTQDISGLTDRDGFNPFRQPFFLRLNLAFGGGWGGRMGVDDTVLPARYEIDYMRLYKHVD